MSIIRKIIIAVIILIIATVAGLNAWAYAQRDRQAAADDNQVVPVELQPTDPQLLNELQKKNVDKEYVSLIRDYGVGENKNPYTITYQDTKSGKQYSIIEPLPQTDSDGDKLHPEWFIDSKNGLFYNISNDHAFNNLFFAEVNALQTTIVIVNDQPDGRRTGDTLRLTPEIFLDGKEITAKSAVPVLLGTDPLNENYHNNVLMWDYGIAKRYERMIEGSFQGYWQFDSNPGGDVRIQYNQTGDFTLKLGEYATAEDVEDVPHDVFSGAEYPFIVNDSDTFYPEAGSYVDGWAACYITNGTDWASILANAGTHRGETDAYYAGTRIIAYTSSGVFRACYRGIYVFPTGSLPDDATISAATFSVRGASKTDGLSTSPLMNIYSSAPAADNTLANSDYSTLGTTAFSASIAYADYSTAGYNDFELNASGIANINLDDNSRFGIRDPTYDVGATTPNWVSGATSYMTTYFVEQGEGYEPKLVVEYSTGTPEGDNDPSTHAFGIIDLSSHSATGMIFNFQNTGTVAIDGAISGTDAVGGDDTWTLSDTATPGSNTYGMKAGTDTNYDTIVKKNSPYNYLVENLPVSNNQTWGIDLYLPTAAPNYDAQIMSANVTIIVTQH